MKKKILYLLCVSLLFLTNCFDGPWTDIRNVEYRPQLQINYCGMACIQMWSIFDGWNPEPTQDAIYDYITANSDHGGYVGLKILQKV